MTKIELLTRAVELIYMRHGVPESALEGSYTDAEKIIEIVNEGLGASTISTVLFLGVTRHGYSEGESSWDDAEFLEALAKAL